MSSDGYVLFLLVGRSAHTAFFFEASHRLYPGDAGADVLFDKVADELVEAEV